MKVGTACRRVGEAVLCAAYMIWAFSKGWQVGLRLGRCTRFWRLRPNEERTDKDMRRGERRVGELCGDRAEVPTSWETKFAEVGNLAKYKFGVSQGLCLYFVKVENYTYIDIWADSYCRELPLPLYCYAFLLYNAVDNECVWVFIGIKAH